MLFVRMKKHIRKMNKANNFHLLTMIKYITMNTFTEHLTYPAAFLNLCIDAARGFILNVQSNPWKSKLFPSLIPLSGFSIAARIGRKYVGTPFILLINYIIPNTLVHFGESVRLHCSMNFPRNLK